MQALFLFDPTQSSSSNFLHQFKESTRLVAEDVAAALALLSAGGLEVVLIRLPIAGWSPSDLLATIHARDAYIPVILWLPHIPTSEAVRLSRLGAYQVLTDETPQEELLAILDRAVEQRRARWTAHMTDSPENDPVTKHLVGESWPMRMIGQVIRLVSPRRCTVLITGETGTGKELVARAIHLSSPRAHLPMVCVNCSALPEELLEAELFGHVRGAFTGAINNRVGRFEQANHSTLFLDEISEMPMSVQAKLLRVLQEREFQRVGSSETVKVDVRVIAASNANLPVRVREGKFRDDLYYRLNVVPVQLPPLKQRKEDIRALAHYFVEKACAAENMPPKVLPREIVDRLVACDWPGNVRQLENTVEMAVALSGDRHILHLSDFPLLLSGLDQEPRAVVVPEGGLNYADAVDQFERSILEQALRMTGGNKTVAASKLSLKRTTFLAKLRTLGVLPPCEAEDMEEDFCVSEAG